MQYVLTLCKKGLKMAQCILQHENQKIIYLKDSIDFNLDDYANNVVYDFCYKDIKTKLYKKRIRLSLIVDLKKDIETIFEDFKPNTRNEINKAKKLNLNIDNNVTLDDLYKMHNKMLESKGLKLVDKTFYSGLSQKPIITSISEGRVVHSYITDDDKKIVFLYSSVSNFRNMNKEEAKIIGYANRYLTYKDMIYFKEKGYEYYDLGCIGFEDEYKRKEPKIWPIVMFKQSFGGNFTKYYQYIPSNKKLQKILKIISNIKYFIKRIMNK